MTDIHQLISKAAKLRPLPAKMSIEDMEAEMRILYTLANLSLASDHAHIALAPDIRLRSRELRESVIKYFDSTTSLKKRSRILLTLYRLITELPMPGNESKLLTDYYHRVDAVYAEWLRSPKRDVATNSYIFCNLVNYFSDIDETADRTSTTDIDPRLSLIHSEATNAIRELVPVADGYRWEEMETSVALHRLSFLATYCHGFHILTPPVELIGAIRHYTALVFNRIPSFDTAAYANAAPGCAKTITPSLLRMLIQAADIHFTTPGDEDFSLPRHLSQDTLSYPLLSILIRTTLSHLLTHSHAS